MNQTDISFQQIKHQLFIDFRHVVKVLELIKDSDPTTILVLSNYCKGVLNGSKLLWEFVDKKDVWTALYVLVFSSIDKVTGTEVNVPSSFYSQHDTMFLEMKNDRKYLDRVLSSFNDDFLRSV